MAFALRQRGTAGAPERTREDGAVRERPRPSRGRLAAARGAWAAGSMLRLIARVVRIVTAIIALLIVIAIVLRVLGANPTNSLVKDVHDAAGFFVGPFKNIFSLKDHKLAMAVNWGIAAVVYLVVGGVIASLISRAAPRGAAPSEPVR